MNAQEKIDLILQNLKNQQIIIELTDGNKLKGVIISIEEDNNNLVFKPDSHKNDEEVQQIKIENIKFFEVYNINNKDKNKDKVLSQPINEDKDYFEVDSKLKKETKYKDDFATFKNKLELKEIKIENLNINAEMNDNKTTVSSDVLEPLNPLDALIDEDKSTIDIRNQFLLNKDKFNVESTYEIHKYTTDLKLDSIDEKMKREAEIIEQLILNDKSKHRHINEERGTSNKEQVDEEDEEFKYSSVYRNNNNKSNKNISPAHIGYGCHKPPISYKSILILFILLTIFIFYLIKYTKNLNNELADNEDEFDYYDE